MKAIVKALIISAALLVLVSCGSTSYSVSPSGKVSTYATGASVTADGSVARIDSSNVVDLTGYWNDSDVRIVCNEIINEILSSPRLYGFYGQYGHYPVFVLGNIKNASDEHIDTEIVANNLRNAILNSGVADFIADKDQRLELRDERSDQQVWAADDQAKAMRAEDAADFMLQGSIRTIVQKNGNNSVRQYYVNIELVDVETGRIIWSGVNDTIKKVWQQANSKW